MRFTEFTGHFINDLLNAKKKYIEGIEDELYEMMNSHNIHTAISASNLYKKLF
jgi:hypothetical protein